jgi:hypothetical protein
VIVVADTSPICYLLLIGEIDLLAALFGRVVARRAVADAASASQPAAMGASPSTSRWGTVPSVDSSWGGGPAVHDDEKIHIRLCVVNSQGERMIVGWIQQRAEERLAACEHIDPDTPCNVE